MPTHESSEQIAVSSEQIAVSSEQIAVSSEQIAVSRSGRIAHCLLLTLLCEKVYD
jgi:hypothetical protein